MSLLLRSLSFLFLSILFLPVDSLCAQAPLPVPQLPRSNADKAKLEGMRTIFSGSRVTNPQITAAEASGQATLIPDRLPPPSQLRQVNQASATFSAHPMSAPTLSDESLYDEPLEEPNYEEEYQDAYHEMLDKPISSKKRTTASVDFAEDKESTVGGWTKKLAKPELTPFVSVAGSLLIVIAAFLLLAILLRKVSPQGNRPLPKEAFECLGRYFLTQKHQLQVLRMGNRIVLVSVMPDGVSTLAEITDPDEAVSFLGLCRRLDTNSATEMFRRTVAGMSEEELSRPRSRPVVTRHKAAPAASFDMYSDPDESLAAILARGRR